MDHIAAGGSVANVYALEPSFMVSDIQGNITGGTYLSAAAAVIRPDYKQYQSRGQIKRYYHIGKYLKNTTGTTWMNLTSPLPVGSLQVAATQITIPWIGYSTNLQIATTEITYYVKARGWKS